jgi:hypothetical protein
MTKTEQAAWFEANNISTCECSRCSAPIESGELCRACSGSKSQEAAANAKRMKGQRRRGPGLESLTVTKDSDTIVGILIANEERLID